MPETQNGFRDEFFFLSNFFASPVTITYAGEDFTFATGEHIFQGMKVAASVNPDRNVQLLRQLEAAPTPGKAKYWGRSIRIDVPLWNSIAEKCMKRTVQLKFDQNPELQDLLAATGGIELVEYNDWDDKLWGKNQATREGQNKLGKILMAYRENLGKK